MGINREGLTFSPIEVKAPAVRPAIQLNQSFLCILRKGSYRGGEGPNDKIVSIKIAVVEYGRHAGRSLIKREYRARPRADPREQLVRLERSDFVILSNQASAPVRKKIASIVQSKKGGSQNKVVKKKQDARKSRKPWKSQ